VMYETRNLQVLTFVIWVYLVSNMVSERNLCKLSALKLATCAFQQSCLSKRFVRVIHTLRMMQFLVRNVVYKEILRTVFLFPLYVKSRICSVCKREMGTRITIPQFLLTRHGCVPPPIRLPVQSYDAPSEMF
jgi:hypothetical protein